MQLYTALQKVNSADAAEHVLMQALGIGAGEDERMPRSYFANSSIYLNVSAP